MLLIFNHIQAHHRNISGLSEISITLDPIKREDTDEIKVSFLSTKYIL